MYMNKTMIALALSLGLMMPANTNAQEMIGKNNIKLESDQMTPEALWAMGRIATAKPSPDGKKIVLQTGYYSVKQNKSHHVLSMMDADGSNQCQLTTTSKNETDPAWIENGTKIAYLSDGQVWKMNPDGTNRQQLTHDAVEIEGFKFSPDGK